MRALASATVCVLQDRCLHVAVRRTERTGGGVKLEEGEEASVLPGEEYVQGRGEHKENVNGGETDAL